jgi:hypothetical protein
MLGRIEKEIKYATSERVSQEPHWKISQPEGTELA